MYKFSIKMSQNNSKTNVGIWIRNVDYEKKRYKKTEAQQVAFLPSLAALQFTDHARNKIIT
jgi:hypothetical protein